MRYNEFEGAKHLFARYLQNWETLCLVDGVSGSFEKGTCALVQIEGTTFNDMRGAAGKKNNISGWERVGTTGGEVSKR